MVLTDASRGLLNIQAHRFIPYQALENIAALKSRSETVSEERARLALSIKHLP